MMKMAKEKTKEWQSTVTAKVEAWKVKNHMHLSLLNHHRKTSRAKLTKSLTPQTDQKLAAFQEWIGQVGLQNQSKIRTQRASSHREKKTQILNHWTAFTLSDFSGYILSWQLFIATEAKKLLSPWKHPRMLSKCLKNRSTLLMNSKKMLQSSMKKKRRSHIRP